MILCRRRHGMLESRQARRHPKGRSCNCGAPRRFADVVRGTTELTRPDRADLVAFGQQSAMLMPHGIVWGCMFHAVEQLCALVLWRCLLSVILPISPRSRLIDHILGSEAVGRPGQVQPLCLLSKGSGVATPSFCPGLFVCEVACLRAMTIF